MRYFKNYPKKNNWISRVVSIIYLSPSVFQGLFVILCLVWTMYKNWLVTGYLNSLQSLQSLTIIKNYEYLKLSWESKNNMNKKM